MLPLNLHLKYIRKIKFTQGEYVSILEGAEFLREFEARKGKMSQDMISRLSLDENEVPLSRVYRLAEDLGIGRQYVDRYLEMRFPSEEQKLEDLKKWNAKPSGRTVINNYKKELESALTMTFPSEKFIFKEDNYFNLEIKRIERDVKKSIFFKRNKIIERKIPLAHISFFNRIDLYDPCFLRACNETLYRLNEAFNRKFETIYHYNVDLVK